MQKSPLLRSIAWEGSSEGLSQAIFSLRRFFISLQATNDMVHMNVPYLLSIREYLPAEYFNLLLCKKLGASSMKYRGPETATLEDVKHANIRIYSDSSNFFTA